MICKGCLRRPALRYRPTERQLIFATLDAVNGKKPEAPEALGISLKTLYNRLNRYAEDEPEKDFYNSGEVGAG